MLRINFGKTFFADILQVVSKPMKIGNKIIPPYHNEDRQNDQASTSSIDEAAKQFKLASAGMNNNIQN
jgi:hypothetical protein